MPSIFCSLWQFEMGSPIHKFKGTIITWKVSQLYHRNTHRGVAARSQYNHKKKKTTQVKFNLILPTLISDVFPNLCFVNQTYFNSENVKKDLRYYTSFAPSNFKVTKILFVWRFIREKWWRKKWVDQICNI